MYHFFVNSLRLFCVFKFKSNLTRRVRTHLSRAMIWCVSYLFYFNYTSTNELKVRATREFTHVHRSFMRKLYIGTWLSGYICVLHMCVVHMCVSTFFSIRSCFAAVDFGAMAGEVRFSHEPFFHGFVLLSTTSSLEKKKRNKKI